MTSDNPNFIHRLVQKTIHYMFADLDLTFEQVNMVSLLFAIVLFILFFLVGAKVLHSVFKTRLMHAKFDGHGADSFIHAALISKVPYHLANFIPMAIACMIAPSVIAEFYAWSSIISAFLDAIFTVFLLRFIGSLLNTVCEFLKTRDHFKYKPLESYVQIMMMVLYFIAMAFLYIKFTNQSLAAFFGTIGAVSAVLLLMFKDTIMGVVTSIQVSTNDMVRVGDWITMSNYGADGTVTEINLTTVKVTNFDNTVTTIPSYSLISNSFQNWRFMGESGGRRICRHLLIRGSSVKFLNDDDYAKYEDIQILQTYLTSKKADIAKYNDKNNIDANHLINGHHLTNLGLFSKYLDTYLNQNPVISKNFTLMVRQLQSNQFGIPLEVYAFSKDTVWQHYEYIQADLFDHVFAAAPFFDLEIYEE